MKKIYTVLAAVVALAGLMGCGDNAKKKAEQSAQTAMRSFDQAPDELKTNYEAVVSAIQASDFASAKAGIDKLTRLELSAEQQQAVAIQKQELSSKLSAAAQSGDEKANKLLVDPSMRRRSR